MAPGEAGDVASMPTASIVNDCNGALTTAVAVCSFLQQSDVFWLAR